MLIFTTHSVDCDLFLNHQYGEYDVRFKNRFNNSSLEGLIARGGIWLGAGGGTEHSLRLARNMILSRLLAPDAFGLMAIVLSFNTFFESFTQIGVKESVIQSSKGNETPYLNGAFWLSFSRALILYVIAFMFVPWLARFYSKPELVTMEKRILPFVSTNEINYLAFKLPTIEFHNELYGYQLVSFE